MATAFSSRDQIVEAAPIADNARPNLDQGQLEEVFEIGRCEAWVKTNGYSRYISVIGRTIWITSYLKLEMLQWVWECGEIGIYRFWTVNKETHDLCHKYS